MSKITAISFDPDMIRIVKARRAGSSLVYERMLTLSDQEFELFLQCDDASGYLVVVNPPDALYETITIPPVEAKLVGQIVSAELQRQHPELSSFTAAYRTIEDVVQDGRTIRRVACCSVPDDLLAELLEPFIRNGKIVHRIHAAPWLLADLAVRSGADLPQTLLCGYDEGERKTLFVQESGAVTFARQVPSDGRGWSAIDSQNVVMTLDYCFQSLRIRPGGTIAMNGVDPPNPPFMVFCPVYPADFPNECQNEMPALLAVLALPPDQAADLRPSGYRKAVREQQGIRSARTVFCATLLLLVILLLWQVYLLQERRRSLVSLRKPPALIQETLDRHAATVKRLNDAGPLLTMVADMHGRPSILQLLTRLRLQSLDGCTIRRISARQEQGTVQLKFDGQISSSSLAGVQTRFEDLKRRLAMVSGVKVGSSGTLDPKEGKFTLEATWTP